MSPETKVTIRDLMVRKILESLFLEFSLFR